MEHHLAEVKDGVGGKNGSCEVLCLRGRSDLLGEIHRVGRLEDDIGKEAAR